MRPIKFRAWDKTNRRMIYFGNFWPCDEYQSLAWQIDKNSLTTSEGSYGLDWDQDNLEIMQFTGLLDKNGCEIWEGDIVKPSNDDNEDSPPSKVVWHESGMFCLEPNPDDSQECIPALGEYSTPGDYWKCEVLGNIYENPELLK